VGEVGQGELLDRELFRWPLIRQVLGGWTVSVMETRLSNMLPVAILAIHVFCLTSMLGEAVGRSPESIPGHDRVSIYHVEPDSRGGQAYKLVYLVQVPIGVYWKFKTHFDNDFRKWSRGSISL
jgi:hypothetical protein